MKPERKSLYIGGGAGLAGAGAVDLFFEKVGGMGNEPVAHILAGSLLVLYAAIIKRV